MRELTLTVPASAVEEVLDRLLPLVAGGVRERRDGRRVELRMRGEDLPDEAELVRAAGRWGRTLSSREVPDDWRERRRLDYVAQPIAGRLVVRPDWAPPSPEAEIELVLEETRAFGGGTHPTTRTCLELVMGMRAEGSFLDLGCGSGVLAILAGRLGFAPVTAIDAQPDAVAAAQVNARANGVVLTASVLDLIAAPAPAADVVAANVPLVVHRAIAAQLPDPVPRTALLSGFDDSEAAEVLDGYARRGLHPQRRADVHGWVVIEVGAR